MGIDALSKILEVFLLNGLCVRTLMGLLFYMEMEKKCKTQLGLLRISSILMHWLESVDGLRLMQRALNNIDLFWKKELLIWLYFPWLQVF